MYDIDPELANSYDAKKQADKQQTPFLPWVDYAGELLLKRVEKCKSRKRGNGYSIKVQCTKSNNPLVAVGGTYVEQYYPGAGDETKEMFWRKILGPLMAASGERDVLKFNAPQALGEFLKLSAEAGDLDLPLGHVRKMEDAGVDKKTGKIDPKNLEADGVTPKKYPRDTFSPGASSGA
jgi:hypothetical protein